MLTRAINAIYEYSKNYYKESRAGRHIKKNFLMCRKKFQKFSFIQISLPSASFSLTDCCRYSFSFFFVVEFFSMSNLNVNVGNIFEGDTHSNATVYNNNNMYDAI